MLSDFLVGEGGFGPPKSLTTDLQSAPFGRSGIPPGAGERSRTINLLITNQLLCHWATPAHRLDDFVIISHHLSFVNRQIRLFCWWGMVDSDHRSQWQQIYSLPPLAAREFPQSIIFNDFGAGEGSRTPNLLITNQLLCHWATPASRSRQRGVV